jgi:hypothetical protein
MTVPARNNWQHEIVNSLEKILEITGPHNANRTRDCLRHYGREVMDCLPCSPGLHFHLVGPLRKYPTNKRLATDADVKQAVVSWLQTRDTNLFCAGIQVLVIQCDIYLNVKRRLCGHLLRCYHMLHVCHVYIEILMKSPRDQSVW